MDNSKHPINRRRAITILLALGFLGATVWTVHQESWQLSAQTASANTRLARIETALRILSGGRENLAHPRLTAPFRPVQNPADSGMEMLTSVQVDRAQGDWTRARIDAGNARALIETAANLRTPSPPGFFEVALARLDRLDASADPDLTQALFGVRVALAEYRSALGPAPQFSQKRMVLEVRPGQPIDPEMLQGATVYLATAQVTLPEQMHLEARGAVIDGSELPVGTEFLQPAGFSFLSGGNAVSGLAFEGLTQSLDGMVWHDVVFANDRIRYHGGPLRLDHVRFLHCTFAIAQNPQGARFANAVAQGKDTLEIGYGLSAGKLSRMRRSDSPLTRPDGEN